MIFENIPFHEIVYPDRELNVECDVYLWKLQKMQNVNRIDNLQKKKTNKKKPEITTL